MKKWLRIKQVAAVTMGTFTVMLAAVADDGHRSIAETIVRNKDGDFVEVHGEVIGIKPRKKEYIIADRTGEIIIVVSDIDPQLNLGRAIDVVGKLSFDPSRKTIVIEAEEVELHQE